MTKIDLDCWEYHIGFLYGANRALGASSEVIKSIDWMRDQIIVGEVETNLDRMLNDTKPAKKIKHDDDFDVPTRVKTVQPYKGASEPGLSAPPVRRQKGEWNGASFEEPKKTKEKGAASEPPLNSLGISDWGTKSSSKQPWENSQIADEEETKISKEKMKPYGWSDEQEKSLIGLVQAGKTTAQISAELSRGYQAVYAKITTLKATGKI